MVNYNTQLDAAFHSLADPTRRDMLRRLARYELSVGELAKKYSISLVAISKHLTVLEKANLIRKRKVGRTNMVTLVPETLQTAEQHLQNYQNMWSSRHDKLAQLLKEGEHYGQDKSHQGS